MVEAGQRERGADGEGERARNSRDKAEMARKRTEADAEAARPGEAKAGGVGGGRSETAKAGWTEGRVGAGRMEKPEAKRWSRISRHHCRRRCRRPSSRW